MSKARTTRDTQLPDGTKVIKGGDMRKIRSPLNHQLATETAQADGSVMNQTANGQRFTVRRMK